MKAVLKEALLYQNSNSLQRRDAAEALQEFAPRMRWRRGSRARVADVGCGDGGVTVSVLKPHLPGTFSKITGCDIAPEMIRHAKMHHEDERIEFRVADIAADLDPDMVGQYDQVFSFYALHWVQQQERALSNIATLLRPGGDCLLVLLGHVPVYDVYRLLAARPEWAELMYDLETYVSPYHDCARPHRLLRRRMRASGFRDVRVQCKRKVFIYEGVDKLRKAVRAVNPFNHRLSPAQSDKFLDDYIGVLREMALLQPTGSSGEVRVRCEYTLLVAYAVK